MPYPRTKPATVAEMFHDPHPGHHSICQTLRELHEEVPLDLQEKVRLAWAMAKKMHNKLKEYNRRFKEEELPF